MPADMHPEDIKAEIRKRGMTISALAEANGMSRGNVTTAISARMSGPAEQVIAKFLGMRPSEIWPSRYDSRGRRIMLRQPRKSAGAA